MSKRICGTGEGIYWQRGNKTAEVSESSLTDLLTAEDDALIAMGELSREFRKVGAPHYARMVEGQMDSLKGAIFAIMSVHGRNGS